jgi:Ni,Fe-hydrogenase III component G
MSTDLPPVEQAPAPPADLVREREVRELTGLLALVVELAGRRSIFPGDWEEIAEQAMGHQSVRTAVAAETDGSS